VDRPSTFAAAADNPFWIHIDRRKTMVSAVSTGSSAAAGGSNNISAQIASLQRQLTALQKQLTKLQQGASTQDTQTQETLLARQIAMIQAEITALQAVAAQKSAMQGQEGKENPSASASRRASGSVSGTGSIVDTQA
jgi:hypothetical protein